MKELVHEEIAQSYDLAAPIEKVFAAITSDIGKWWTHRFREGSTVGFEPKIGGRFYEEWAGGSAALYATVTYIEPPARLRLSGPMGMDGAVTST
ncbi:MAG TPA: SRPBCC domain-containing protein, partial [Rectinemataceae bacterium]|nr:SRPBCC domain-containing protein [Rectinemataceae bacterium]